MGGTTQISAPAPVQPSTSSSVQDWANALPQIYNTQMQYAPLQAQQQVDLAQQYAAPLGQAMETAQSAMYPQTTALQENLAGQAATGMQSPLPDWMKQQYQSDMNAQLGTNVNAPIGADYSSRGLMQLGQNWQQYYQNLGLSVTGRQPLNQATAPNTADYLSGFTPNSVMQSQNQNYGTASNVYGSQLGYNSAANQSMMNLIGSGIGAAGSIGASAAMMSSRRYKNRIKKWE